MHYYQFNIGDYTSHTRGLSLMEDLAYRRLIDDYFLNERPLNGCSTDVARIIGMVEHADSVAYVLSRFFMQDGDQWRHERIESDISAFHHKSKSASKAGKKSAESRRKKKELEQPLNDCSTDVEQTLNDRATNHKPITNNHKPKEKIKPPPTPPDGGSVVEKPKRERFKPPTVEEVADYCLERRNTVDPMAFLDFYDANGWKVGKNPMKDWKAAVRTWENRRKEENGKQQQRPRRQLL